MRQRADARDCGETQGARDDCCVAFGSAQNCRNADDAARIHEGGVGGRDFFRQNNAALGRFGKRVVVLL